MARILVVDSEADGRASIEAALNSWGHESAGVASAEQALAILRDRSFDLTLTDVRLPGMSGLALARRLREERPALAVVVMSGVDSSDDAIESMETGARSFVRKPLEPGRLAAVVAEVLEPSTSRERVPGAEHADESEGYGEILGRSKGILDLLKMVQRVSSTDSTVLVTGETGTGKELIGRAIHRGSTRSKRVFCAVNSAAFTETLLESELFGYRRGAFTGAATNRKGIFEYADRGTVFLDEVAEMPPSMQAKLLRFLQSGEIRPVGSEQSHRVDVRLVAATNKDLEREVEEKRFREDLYYRLAVIPLHVPPLRERAEDIPLLARSFAERFATRQSKALQGIAPEAMEALCTYAWPGNVRELENAIERGVALSRDGWVARDDLPARIGDSLSAEAEALDVDSLDMVERRHILKTLEKVNWNRSKAAALLRISTTTLWRRLKEFGVDGRPSGSGSGRPVSNA